MIEHKHLKRLDRLFVREPIFFITTCTHERKPILANAKAAEILVEEWNGCLDRHGWMVGRYVIMPEHVHFFCVPVAAMGDRGYRNLSNFMRLWKQWTSKKIVREYCSRDGPSRLQAPIWQKEIFDHLLRSEESYCQKWEYVRQNPVRAGLVESFEDWPWQGEIDVL